jgi:branched-chain amino acid transport system substrate-binding protein
MIRRSLAAVAVCALALLQPTAAPAADPVQIGVILSTTGAFAVVGEPQRNAIELAEREINAHGGIKGRLVKFLIQDDETKPDVASQLATQYIGAKMPIIVGGSNTASSSAIARTVRGTDIVQIYMSPTAQIWDTPGGPVENVFEITPRNEVETRALVTFARTKLKVRRIAILHDENQYGTLGAQQIIDEAKAQGLEVVGNEAYGSTATDVSPQILKIKATPAQVVFLYGATQTAAIAVRQLKQLGARLPIVGSVAILSDNFLRITGPDGEGVYSDTNLNFTHPSANQRAFIEAYHAAYHARPTNFAAYAWDAVHVAADALRHAKSWDAKSVAAALTTMPPHKGTSATFRYSAKDHNGVSTDDVHMAIDKNGIWFNL